MTTAEYKIGIENISSVAKMLDRKYVTGIDYDCFFTALDKNARRFKELTSEFQIANPLSNRVLGNLTSAYRYVQIKNPDANLPPINSENGQMSDAVESIFADSQLRKIFAEALTLPFGRSQTSRYDSVLSLPFAVPTKTDELNNKKAKINLLDLGCGPANLGGCYLFSDVALKRVQQLRSDYGLNQISNTPELNIVGIDPQKYNIRWAKACSTLGIPNNPVSEAMDYYFNSGYQQLKKIGMENVTYIQQSAFDIPKNLAGFNVVTCFFMLGQQSPSVPPIQLLNENVSPLLEENGVFLFADGDTRATDPLTYYIKIWQKQNGEMIEIGNTFEMSGVFSQIIRIIPGTLKKLK